MGPTHESINNDFSHHPPTDITAEIHNAARQNFANIAHWVIDNVPSGAARSTAVAKIREAMMWANAAIACDSNSGAVVGLKQPE